MGNKLRARQRIYSEIERDRYFKIAYMCRNCMCFVNNKCTESKCINEVRRSVINEDSKDRNLKIKRGGLQSDN